MNSESWIMDFESAQPSVGARRGVAQTSCLWGQRASCPMEDTTRSNQRGQDARLPHRLEACATLQ